MKCSCSRISRITFQAELMNYLILFFSFLFCSYQTCSQSKGSAVLTGAWKLIGEADQEGLWIFTEDHFSISYYQSDPPQFLNTKGGQWQIDEGGNMAITWEYNTEDTTLTGLRSTQLYGVVDSILVIGDSRWSKVDDGTPGALAGAWVITGRKREGEWNEITPGARKTMKILSGTKFQWIAYNTKTKQFFGTGGGTYTTSDGKYTEQIAFFSRDNSRVGALLEFDYELKDVKWHHSGKSSKGDPLNEVWSDRTSLGL